MFKKKKYTIIRQAISKDLATFIANYFLMKKQVLDTCIKQRYISPFETLLGSYDDEQIPNTYSHYADIAMETLMLKCQPQMEKITELKLYPAYSYARIFKKRWGSSLFTYSLESTCIRILFFKMFGKNILSNIS